MYTWIWGIEKVSVVTLMDKVRAPIGNVGRVWTVFWFCMYPQIKRKILVETCDIKQFLLPIQSNLLRSFLSGPKAPKNLKLLVSKALLLITYWSDLILANYIKIPFISKILPYFRSPIRPFFLYFNHFSFCSTTFLKSFWFSLVFKGLRSNYILISISRI